METILEEFDALAIKIKQALKEKDLEAVSLIFDKLIAVAYLMVKSK